MAGFGDLNMKFLLILAILVIMSPPEGLGDILFFPWRPSVRMSVCLSVCLSVTNRVRSVT